MITEQRKFFLILIALAVMGLVFGCGSGKKEGETRTSTVVLPSANGNLQSKITGVSVNGAPVVTFTLYDQDGKPLDPNTFVKQVSEGGSGGSIRFTIAQLGTDDNYKNYILNSAAQPTFDSGGAFATVEPGVYTYTFKSDITSNPMYDPSLTQTVGAQIERDVTTSAGTSFQQAVNPYLDFRPNGQPVTMTREIVSISACNECHYRLGMHGGGRRDVALCILCHNPGVVDPDTGNSIDFKSLIHKIHMGKELPSNIAGGDYTIVGYQGSVHSYADVTFPFMSGDSFINGTPVDCVKCHQKGKDLMGNDYGKNVDLWKEAPSMAACTSCHDLLTFDGSTSIDIKNGAQTITVTAKNHPGGQFPNDEHCAGCHPDSGKEYGISIPGAHTIIERSSVFTGINFKIISVTNALPGKAPTVTFEATDNSGNPLDPAAAGTSFNLKLGYPTTDYTNDGMGNYGQPLSQPLAGATANGDGTYTITFSTPIPAKATGVGVIGLEGRKTYTISSYERGTEDVEVGGQAVQYYFDLSDGSQVTDPSLQRRKVVDVQKCIGCHGRLSLHGANRVNSVQECVICHNPNATDRSQRPADPRAAVDGLAERPIDFKRMIHKIHTGADLSNKPYIIYGYHGSVNDFSDVTYPQNRMHCLGCHFEGTFGLPLPDVVTGTTVSTGQIANQGSDNTRIPPMTSVCTSCHDSSAVLNHTDSKVVGGIETCLQCHRDGLLLGPSFVHQGDYLFP